jgi:uncharacterized membrane protein
VESVRRSVIKSISWYIINILMVGLVAFLLTGDLWIAIVMSLAQTLLETVVYYVHERAWARLGRRVA